MVDRTLPGVDIRVRSSGVGRRARYVRCIVICSPPTGHCKTSSARRAHRCSRPSRRCCTSAIAPRVPSFNAALRPYLYVHKGATQGFLDLFRAWFNLRTRRWGRHKGTSAHECLTGQRVHDWLTLLGCPPSPTLH